MFKQFKYHESSPMRWLSILFISLSCFAFSLSPIPANARQPLPAQIEQVASTQDDNGNSVEYQKIAATACSFHSVNRSREHEKNVLLNYQNELKVHFESSLKKLHSFLKPDCFLYPKMIPQNSDEDTSPSVIV